MPGFASFLLGDCHVSDELERAAFRIGPGNAILHVLDDLPVGKVLLNLIGIGELKGAEDQARGLPSGIMRR
jgi:hypothetical protein